MTILTLPLPIESAIEGKRTLVWTNAIPCAITDHTLFKNIVDSCIKTHQHRRCKRRQKNLRWQGVIGSLTSAKIEAIFYWTFHLKLTWLLSHDIQSVSSFRLHVHCIVSKTTDFPRSKNKHTQIVFWSLLKTYVYRRGLMDSSANRD